WLKIKPTQSADFVIGGYTKGQGVREPLGALLLGYWERGKLRYASHVGSGFDDRTLKKAKAQLDDLKRKTCPFAETPELNAPTSWVEPKLVAEVKFHSWTEDGSLRAPIFMRLRDDIDAKSIRKNPSSSRKPGAGSETANRDSRVRGNREIAEVL